MKFSWDIINHEINHIHSCMCSIFIQPILFLRFPFIFGFLSMNIGIFKEISSYIDCKSQGKKEADNSLTLARGDVSDFLAEQKRSFNAKFQELSKEFSDTKKLITSAEAQIVVTSLHMMNIAQRYYDGVNYVEFLLRKQLIAAIGREVGSGDFENYMKFHNRKLYREEYQPLPFCFAVRRPKHYPEGTVSIEQR
jgi:hypothetical protein